MLWFHSVTVGGSVLSGRNKLHVIWKVVLYFLKIKFSKIFKFYIKLDEKKLIFVIQIGQFYKKITCNNF
jgi:hypothetical protein